MKEVLVILLMVTFSTVANAQKRDSVHYISFTSTGIINKTNETNSYLLSNALRFGIKKPAYHLNINNSWVYGQQQRRTTNNDLSSAIDWNIFVHARRLYYWGLLTYDKSISLKINNRFQGGAGLAYSFIDTDSTFLNISDGIVYERSNLKINDSTNNENQTFRNSLRIRGKYSFKKIFSIETTSFWQPSLQYQHDYVIKSNTSLSLKLSSWFSLTTVFTYNKLNRLNRENMLITFGLKAEKSF